MTLFSLPETAQEVFDIVAVHMLKQKSRSVNCHPDSGDKCAYRGDDGRKCAAGCLIPDKVYDSKYEDILWQDLVLDHDFPHNHAELIAKLQQIHDCNHPLYWCSSLISLAKTYSLNTDILNTI